MALGQTDINTTLVGNLLGTASRLLSTLCTYVSINKWSRYKPVAGTYPEGTNYGLNIPTNWDYNKPTVNFRLGDFRGYEHNKSLTPPPVRSESPPSGTYYPTISDYPTASKPKEDNWLCYINVSDNNIKITPSDLYVSGTSLSNYYFGVRLNKTGSATYYYKTRQVALTNNSQVIFDLKITDLANLTYVDFPSTGSDVGTWNYMIFISSTKTATEAWTTTAPSGIIQLPTDADIPTIVSSGTFNVGHYIVCGTASISLPASATSPTSGYVATLVNTSSSNAFTLIGGDA